MPIFSNFSQNRFNSSDGTTVIMAYPKLHTASMISMSTREFNPGADDLRINRTAMTRAVAAFRNNMEAKIIH